MSGSASSSWWSEAPFGASEAASGASAPGGDEDKSSVLVLPLPKSAYSITCTVTLIDPDFFPSESQAAQQALQKDHVLSDECVTRHMKQHRNEFNGSEPQKTLVPPGLPSQHSQPDAAAWWRNEALWVERCVYCGHPACIQPQGFNYKYCYPCWSWIQGYNYWVQIAKRAHEQRWRDTDVRAVNGGIVRI